MRTPDELDALIDQVRTESHEHRVPAMVQINIAGRKRLPVLEVGLGQTAGFIPLPRRALRSHDR
ncbi:Imm1 family immunity protein [Actinokineospora pegani]|uniref:Imm1 family immunity protein n=1 Tax=Actinokineospora pegani TaxID=2654637 RepID=UPI0038B34215